jgi:hypothetical protein
MTTKIDFFIRCRVGGGFIARSHMLAVEAQADTLANLRTAVKRVVRTRLGADRPVCLRVGETPGPELVAVAPAVESTLES